MKHLISIVFSCGVLLALFSPSVLAVEDLPLLDGEALYARHCAACHKPLPKTTKAGRGLLRIRSSIRHYSVMNHLRDLSDDELQAIVNALALPSGR